MIPCGSKHEGILTVILKYKHVRKKLIQCCESFETVVNLSDYTASSTGRLIFISYFPYSLLLCCIALILCLFCHRSQVISLEGLRLYHRHPACKCAVVGNCQVNSRCVQAVALLVAAGKLPCGWATAVTHSLLRASHEPQQCPEWMRAVCVIS